MHVFGQLLEAQLEVKTTAALGPGKKALIRFDDTLGKLVVFDGTAWVEYLTTNNDASALGDIKTSQLADDPNPTPAAGTFQGEHNTSWQLCDGSNVSGSDYHTVTGNVTVPDFQAVPVVTTKKLTADSAAVLTDLGDTSLVIGERYELSGQISVAAVGSVSDIGVKIEHDGNIIAQVLNGEQAANNGWCIPFCVKFLATANDLVYTPINMGGTVRGNNTFEETFSQLEKVSGRKEFLDLNYFIKINRNPI